MQVYLDVPEAAQFEDSLEGSAGHRVVVCGKVIPDLQRRPVAFFGVLTHLAIVRPSWRMEIMIPSMSWCGSWWMM